jgi:hypothetical protein
MCLPRLENRISTGCTCRSLKTEFYRMQWKENSTGMMYFVSAWKGNSKWWRRDRFW